jgi:Alkylmercury lyase
VDIQPWQVRAQIYDGFLRKGVAPPIAEVAVNLQTDQQTVIEHMRWLHEQHHIVMGLFDELIAAHPFSNVPSPFEVTFGRVKARGFCIWDALGIPAMSGKNTIIETVCSFCLHHIHLEVEHGQLLLERDYVAQFLVPAQRMWDDVKFTCSTQLAFCDETHAKRWRERFHREPGSILHMSKTWELANVWYGEDRRLETWRRRTPTEANAIFRRLELPEPFWHLSPIR